MNQSIEIAPQLCLQDCFWRKNDAWF